MAEEGRASPPFCVLGCYKMMALKGSGIIEGNTALRGIHVISIIPPRSSLGDILIAERIATIAEVRAWWIEDMYLEPA